MAHKLLVTLLSLGALWPAAAAARQLPPPAFPPGVCAQPAARVCAVPGDYATLGEALAAAPTCGTIALAAGDHAGVVTVNHSVTIQGASSSTTTLKGHGLIGPDGPVLTFTGPMTGTRVCA